MTAKKEWTRNRGKQPVGGRVWVEIRCRDKNTDSGPAAAFDWEPSGLDCDIMAWRRVRKPRKTAAIAPDHAPRPAVPEAKPAPVLGDKKSSERAIIIVPSHDAPRRPRLMDVVLAIVVAVVLIAAVCYVF